ncbi:AraC family transcriptional regulator [Streptomyces sp. NPDC057877]|uniref:AraC family transcriptional regulator n=1 Tax=Streptomyces sp. NPDC057877 TaxID=3346269 RepID=UPI0036BF7F63
MWHVLGGEPLVPVRGPGARGRRLRRPGAHPAAGRVPPRAVPGAPSSGTIAALSRRPGFRSPSHFSRAFKAAYGIPPRAWRELRHKGTSVPGL